MRYAVGIFLLSAFALLALATIYQGPRFARREVAREWFERTKFSALFSAQLGK